MPQDIPHDLHTLIQRVEEKWESSLQAQPGELQTSDLVPLAMLHCYWRQVPQDERIRFLCEMLTPNERRALQYGFDDLDE